MKRMLALCLLSVPFAFPLAGQPQLLLDINTTTHGGHSSPRSFIELDGLAYFWTTGPGDSPPELWRSAGTTETTTRVGACLGCDGQPENFFASRATGRVYFRLSLIPGRLGAATPEGLEEILGGDGVMIDWDSFVDLPARGLVGFRITTGWAGPEVWVTDGTRAGTRPLQRVMAPRHPHAKAVLAFKDFLYFIADDGTSGPALWRSDGTPAGTRLWVDLVPRSRNHPAPELLAASSSLLMFAGWSRDHGEEPWVSDGTAKGTRRIADLVPGRSGSNALAAVPVGTQMFFVADTRGGQELHSFDGRRVRTVSSFRNPRPLLDPFAGAAIEFAATLGDRLVFLAFDSAVGVEPWVADGRVGGTHLLADICPGSCSSLGRIEGAALGEALVFPAFAPTLGDEPWITDGTPTGTRVLRDLCRGPCSSLGSLLGEVAGEGLLGARGPDNRFQAWRTDGTSAGTRRLLFGDRLSSGSLALDGVVLLGLDDGLTGEELWAWRPESTLTQVADLVPGTGDGLTCAFASAGEDLYFLADDVEHGIELWTTRGTTGTTRLLAEAVPGPEPVGPFSFSALEALDLGARALVSVSSAPSAWAGLWGTDGTAEGTVRIAEAAPATLFQGRGYFARKAADRTSTLAATDGTLAGTVQVAAVPGPVSRGVVLGDHLIYVGQRVFPDANPPVSPRFELWATDGTSGGTRLLSAAGDARFPSRLTELGGRVYFLVALGDFSELWSTDGTLAGTARVTDQLFPFNRSTTFEPLGGRLLFTGVRQGVIDAVGAGRSWFFDPGTATLSEWSVVPSFLSRRFDGDLYFVPAGTAASQQSSLWKTDGTDAGTVPILTATGGAIPGPTQIEVVDNQLVTFNAGSGLWATDGTPAGTRVLFAGRAACPDVGVVGNQVFIGLDSADTGREAWLLEP
jgi:large repetitive protein